MLALLIASFGSAQSPVPAASPARAMRTITDQLGREVAIPEPIGRVVITGILPIPSVFCIVDGSGEKIVGMAPASMGAAENSMLRIFYPEVLNASTSFMRQEGSINLEELSNLRPDVVFCSADSGEHEVVAKTGIPVVAIRASSAANGNALETVNGWVDLLGDVLGKRDRAKTLKAAGYEMLGEVASKLWLVPEDKRPSVLFLFNHTDKIIRASGRDFFGDFWIRAAGGVNAAAELTGRPEISMEEVYNWNPDYIFITNFSPTLPKDILNNAIPGQDWSHVKAVREGRVFKMPIGIYRWFPPSTDSPVVVKWMAQKLHPEVFSYYDMNEVTRGYYRRFYGHELTPEELRAIFNPTRDTAKGYR